MLDLRYYNQTFDDVTLVVHLEWDPHVRGDWYFEGGLLELQT
jgi:hypothetical protein